MTWDPGIFQGGGEIFQNYKNNTQEQKLHFITFWYRPTSPEKAKKI